MQKTEQITSLFWICLTVIPEARSSDVYDCHDGTCFPSKALALRSRFGFPQVRIRREQERCSCTQHNGRRR